MAEVPGPTGESKGTEVKTQQATEKTLRAPPRRGPTSVLKVSQLLLRAITAHKGLTLATLKKELGNAGYEVRRKCRHSGEAPRSDVKGTLLRVSGSDASGYFRVWKSPKPKRKPGRPRLEEGVRSSRRTPRPRSPRRRSTHRRAAKKARELWRQSTKGNTRMRKVRPRAKDSVRSKAKEGARAKVMNQGRGQTMKEDIRPRTRQKRPSSKPREEKQQDQETLVKRTIQKTSLVKSDLNFSGQGRPTHDPRAVRTKTSTKA